MPIRDYLGDEYQLFGAKRFALTEGQAKGMEFLHLKNGKGLEMNLSLDRNGDISSLSYKGMNLAFLSPCGYVHSSYYDGKGMGFLKSFTAGFLTTCGLTTFGSPSIDEGEELPLHGTIANTPVSNSSYEVLDTEIVTKTLTKDEHIFSHKLALQREIRLSLENNSFLIKDIVENRGDRAAPLMLLYHMNLGYPLLDEDASLYISNKSVRPRNEESKKHMDTRLLIEKPQKEFVERCYYYAMEEDPFAVLVNKKLGFGLKISYKKDTLPCFTEWKMMGIRDYVLGLEPGTNFPDGRSEARKEGTLQFLKPNEKREFNIRVDIVEDF